MYNTLTKKSKSNKGFTLIELIVVIAIIAILALILVPRFGGFTQGARDSADNATARAIETAVTTLYVDGRLTGSGTFQVDDDTLVPAADITGTIAYNAPAAGRTLELDMQALLGTDVDEQGGAGTGFLVTVTAGTLDINVTRQ